MKTLIWRGMHLSLRQDFINSLLCINVHVQKYNFFLSTLQTKYLSTLKMNSASSKLNSEIESTHTKRPLETETDETWVKRIQLAPVLEEEKDEKEYIRRKLRKFVLLLSYCGKEYCGMQRNPQSKTIEDTLFDAMWRASLVKKEMLSCPQMIRFQRAARTDKGVSAARQIVSVKLPDDVDIPSAINQHLPEEIRVMKSVRVTQKFDAKLQCDSRSYSYLTPTFAFAPLEVITDESYRITNDVLEEIRSVLSIYKGTHNFHNFTARTKFSDRSARRYIMDITCSDPVERNGLEFVLIKVRGQSFMLHQIRKMVGLTMAICKGFATKEVFDKVWASEKLDIPIAPGLGLVLEEPHYDYYNKKYDDGFHTPLKWDDEEPMISAFREKYIDSEIITTEVSEKPTLTWLKTLAFHTYDYRSDGVDEEKIENKSAMLRAALNLYNANQECPEEDPEADEEFSDDGDSNSSITDNNVVQFKDTDS